MTALAGNLRLTDRKPYTPPQENLPDRKRQGWPLENASRHPSRPHCSRRFTIAPTAVSVNRPKNRSKGTKASKAEPNTTDNFQQGGSWRFHGARPGRQTDRSAHSLTHAYRYAATTAPRSNTPTQTNDTPALRGGETNIMGEQRERLTLLPRALPVPPHR